MLHTIDRLKEIREAKGINRGELLRRLNAEITLPCFNISAKQLRDLENGGVKLYSH